MYSARRTLQSMTEVIKSHIDIQCLSDSISLERWLTLCLCERVPASGLYPSLTLQTPRVSLSRASATSRLGNHAGPAVAQSSFVDRLGRLETAGLVFGELDAWKHLSELQYRSVPRALKRISCKDCHPVAFLRVFAALHSRLAPFNLPSHASGLQS